MKNDIYNTNEKIDDTYNSIKYMCDSMDELNSSQKRLNDILDSIVLKINQYPEH
ncbi:MAG TPA: hypothetical protein QF753_00040 [Victivallales bacterium]|nr:hypothetical protein [Victivallales bacterium]